MLPLDRQEKLHHGQRRRIAKRPRGGVAIGLALLRLRRHLVGLFAMVNRARRVKSMKAAKFIRLRRVEDGRHVTMTLYF